MKRLAFALSLLLLACESNVACHKARLEGSDAWKRVAESAGKLKLQGRPGFEELDQAQKAKHHEAFAEVEKQADMVFQSFAYEKITWNTADPAKQKANQAFNDYPAKSEYTSFQMTLNGANKQFDATAAACK